jgi:hypothetical protein
MAKKDEQKTKLSGNGQNTVQGFVFGINLKGTESVVMEGIKAFTQAMEKSGMTLAPPVTRPALASGGKKNSAPVIEQEAEETVDENPDEEMLEAEADEVEETESSSNGNGAGRKRRIPPSPKLVSDLDITAEPMPFRTFIEQKGPRKSRDRIAVVATWLKKHRNFQEIRRDHLYTVYQQMGGTGEWKCLNNWDSMLLQLGKRKGWFEKGADEASYKVSIVATNYVDAMTPAGA